MFRIKAAAVLVCMFYVSFSACAQSVTSPALVASGTLNAATDEVKRLTAVEQRLVALEAELLPLRRRSEQQVSPWVTVVGVVVAALIGGFFALRNQNHQATQERLLKAVEIVMDSRNGYQAEMRAKNLSVFLDSATRQHLDSIRTSFSGPEYTDLRKALAESMAAKAGSAAEVLQIWQAVLDDNSGIMKVRSG